MTRRALTLLTALTAGLLLTTAPAAADPAGPTHYRSTVLAVSDADGNRAPLDVEVLGGDAFLLVRAEPGVLVEVPGYDGEPYVRIEPDGTVHVNEFAPARWLNDARYGSMEIDVPAHADADAPPQWTLAARGGEFAWHDHRIHYMSPSLPSQVDPAANEVQPVWEWTVPLVADGREITVQGELVWVPGPGPILPVALVAVLTVAAVALVLRWGRLAGPMALTGALVCGGVGLAKLVDVPAGADGEPALVALPVVTLAVLVAGLVSRRSSPTRAAVLVAAAGIPLLVWAILQSGALTRPIVPGPVAVEVVRVVVAVAFAAGLAGVAATVRAVLTALAADDAPAADPVT